MIDTQLAHAAGQTDHAAAELKAVEEYAAECSMVKVFAAEMLDYVADEGVQIHGGYGFHKDYSVERTYRDSRINRLFEGTSEINRLVIAGMPLKRAAKSGNTLLESAREAARNGVHVPSASSDEEMRLVRCARQIALLTLGIADKKYGAALEKQQEVIMNISDIFTEVFAMESTLLRSRKMGATGKGETAAAICAVFVRDALIRIATASQTLIGACCEGAELQTSLASLHRLADHQPVNSIALRRQIAAQALASERYPF
jgi:alkylation response protein AidB-like acyl-CoA dehydrogenase